MVRLDWWGRDMKSGHHGSFCWEGFHGYLAHQVLSSKSELVRLSEIHPPPPSALVERRFHPSLAGNVNLPKRGVPHIHPRVVLHARLDSPMLRTGGLLSLRKRGKKTTCAGMVGTSRRWGRSSPKTSPMPRLKSGPASWARVRPRSVDAKTGPIGRAPLRWLLVAEDGILYHMMTAILDARSRTCAGRSAHGAENQGQGGCPARSGGVGVTDWG